MYAFEPRSVAAVLLLAPTAALYPLARFLAARTPRPSVVWGACAYLLLLHLIYLYGLLSGHLFDTALTPLTLFTFPASIAVSNKTNMAQGFATLGDLLANYLRYVIEFGSIDALLLAGFLVLALPARRHGKR